MGHAFVTERDGPRHRRTVTGVHIFCYIVLMTIHQITTLDAPGVDHYRTLRRPEEHSRQGLFIAEGEKVVVRLFESSLEVLSVLVTPEWLDVHRALFERRSADLVVHVAPKDLLESIVGFHLHQGIMALGRVPAAATIDSVLASSASPRLLVALDGLANAENVGVVVRNCAAFGATAVIAGETSSSPYLRRSVRNSMGTVFRLPVIHAAHLPSLLEDLWNDHRIDTIAAVATPGATPLHEAQFGHDVCIVLGSEGDGLSEEVRAACRQQVVIPMADGVDSLNVASASAVFLAEVQRQRVAR